ncbi:MAG: bifunctional diaminohydroxyphosphoribosylaminopyrimidine deaminase/5-amino-6-(5-phosphoribosylamino)uracil reductase RibD [Bacteroidota bacterium]
MSDILFMQRALDLAQRGKGLVAPNPMVGCVIVDDQKIIGEGYHKNYGEAHAEVNAINSVGNPDLLRRSTVYVSLEPCAHFGKTPPCADLLIHNQVKKVIVACEDPFNLVDGKGIERLKDAGIEVEVGVLKNEAISLNKRFFTFHQKKRPYIILKWAQTADGFVARENHDAKWISNPYSRQLVHKWRTEEDAILVGKDTALYDNPSLTARDWSGKNPTRILLDSKLELPYNLKLYNQEADSLILNTIKFSVSNKNTWLKLSEITPQTVLHTLYEKNIQSVIIEGGKKVLNAFIQENCWDEARIFVSTKTFGKGLEAPQLQGDIEQTEKIQEDQLFIYRNVDG